MNTKPVTPMTVSEEEMASLAAQIAANLRPPAEILKQHGLTTGAFKRIAATPQFKQIYAEAKRLWHADTSAPERVRAKALMALEQMLLEVVRVVHDPETNAAMKLEGVKVTTKLAGMEKAPEADQGGPKFSVTINIPGQETRTIEAATFDPRLGADPVLEIDGE